MNRWQIGQLKMAGYLRDPQNTPAPAGIEARRLKVYRDLVYNNIEGFISGGFPVLRSLYSNTQWQRLIERFLLVHRCRSPYFLQISEEFIRFLNEEYLPQDDDPPFMAELAHYEWVELALDVSDCTLIEFKALPLDKIAESKLELSELAWVLSYSYPVHQIGPGFRPDTSDEPTFLVVYRNREDEVKFIQLNPATAQLLQCFAGNQTQTTIELVASLAQAMGSDVATIGAFAMQQVHEFVEKSILVQA